MKKKSIIYIISTVIFLFMSCKKNDMSDLENQELDLLQKYITENNIDVTPTASGLYFIELEADTGGIQASSTDYVIITYTAKLINNTVFDCTNEKTAKDNNIYSSNILYGSLKFIVSNSIAGMFEGLGLMNEGDSAQLIIPSKLGFGEYATSLIPPYSTLIYNIRLQKVINDPIAYENQLLSQYIADKNITVPAQTSGLYYIQNTIGTGTAPINGDKLELKYSIYLLDGRLIESSDNNSVEIIYNTNELIKGYSEGLSLMKEGGNAQLIIPYNLAYGEAGTNSSDIKQIPPYSTLIFNIEFIRKVN